MYYEDLAATAAITFSDISKEEGLAWMKMFPRHSAVSFTNELTYAGYKNIPVSYLFCEEDLCILPSIQKAGIDLIENVSGKNVDVTSIKAGHVPIASVPQVVIDWVLDVASKV